METLTLTKRVNIIYLNESQEEFLQLKEAVGEFSCPGKDYRLDWAPDVRMAFTLLESGDYHVGIMEDSFDDQDGMPFLEDLHIRNILPPVLLLGGEEFNPDIAGGMESGIVDILNKYELSPPLLERSISYAVQRNKVETEIRKRRTIHPQSGLPNRQFFTKVLDHAIRHHVKGSGPCYAVLLFKLGNIQRLYEQYGPDTSKNLIRTVVGRLKAGTRKADLLGHIDKDKFALLVKDFSDVNDVLHLSNRMEFELHKPIVVEGKVLSAPLRIGIVVSDKSYQNSDTVMMEAIKAAHDSSPVSGMVRTLRTQNPEHYQCTLLSCEAELRRALRKEEFTISYQPIVSSKDFKLTRLEALVRWQHPSRGVLFPSDFLRLLEETGLIIPLGDWIFHQVCRQMKRWSQVGFTIPKTAMNISARQLYHSDLMRMLHQALNHSGMDPGSLEMEVTELLATRDFDLCKMILRNLTEMGVGISLDNFGKDTTTMKLLRNMAVQTIKIDKSLTQSLSRDSHQRDLLKGVVDVAKHCKLKTVVEGVETPLQLSLLAGQHCDEYQGFLFSKPLDASQITPLLLYDRALQPGALQHNVV